jgi:hypothetical protein
MTRKEVYAVAVVVAVMSLALWRIGASVYEYALWEMDRNTPAIEAPPTPAPPVALPDSDEQQQPGGCYTQDCLARQIIRI